MLNLEEQNDRIFKYLYFYLHDRHMAEDMTQEAFLRFLGSRTYRDENVSRYQPKDCRTGSEQSSEE